jgi:hypothetical protein
MQETMAHDETVVSRGKPQVLGTVLAGILLGSCALAPRATATIYTLNPSGSIAATLSTYPMGGGLTLLDQTNYTFNTGTLEGTVTSSVYSGDTSNPNGGLTFTYLLSLFNTGTDSSSEMTVGGYKGFLTDVSYNTGGAMAPSTFTRSGDGNVVRFVWGGGGLPSGDTGDLVVVQSSASNYQVGQGAVIDSLAGDVWILTPTAVPEPGVGVLLTGGLGALVVFLRRRNSK